ncbi:hypothetical protein MLD38_025367 [Melastoma candidum]|uniref:Uncharacterized protein n=1 Tax=Melastoma candidum TaxID=119954 RepID=A0ACB9NV85_9MYRT|nr:hypothetical protein MLD38_025367 [Melastoma candidum]
MAIPASLVIVPVGILFFLSGLIVNILQAVVYVLIRPISNNTYRRVNKVVAELLWLELIWLLDWWGGIKVEMHMDRQSFEMMGKEHALLVCNHRSDIDWLVGWLIAQRAGVLGSALAIMKKEAKFLPIIGWSMWFSDYVFLNRSWAKDERRLKSGFERLADFPMPFWLALFVEGTRFTKAKLAVAQEFAASKGLPIPRNVLIPRTKGFVSAVKHTRSYIPAIYDCTVAVASDQPKPTLVNMLRRKSFVVKLQVKRVPMQELPETDDGIAQWCRDSFVTKDAFLEAFHGKDQFGNEPTQDLGRPISSLLVVICWTCLLVYGVVMFFRWTCLLSTWVGCGAVAAVLVLVITVMQVLIQSSEAERSNPVAVDPLKESLLQN